MRATDYLASSFRPDREFLNGLLLDRSPGEYEHSNLQGALITWLRNRQREWNIRALPEQRIQVSTGRYRVPDVCVISRDQTIEPVFTRPPLVCIEILSKDDTLRGMQERVDDYLRFGVADVWILDPVLRRAYVCTAIGLQEPAGGVLQARSAANVRIPLPELFAELD
ncbi:MAG: Uma2 family endonuclease [Bryobacteraceae bacterium]